MHQSAIELNRPVIGNRAWLPPVATPGGLFNRAVLRLDGRLRHRQNIFEFCDRPHCLLRVALCVVKTGIILPDGCQVRRGEVIGELHLWNEHVPIIPAAGPDLSWAVNIQRRMRQSLVLLSQHVQSDARFDQIRFFRAETRLGGGKPCAQMERIARFFGFQLTRTPPLEGLWHGLIDLGERIHLWAMIRAFNPRALAGRGFLPTKHELWMSREVLLSKRAPSAIPSTLP